MNEHSEPFSLRRALKIGSLTLLLGSMAIYVLFQARHIILGPQITLTYDPAIQHTERTVELVGRTSNISRLWLNDRSIYTDRNGNFKETVTLENGYTVATLRAEDRYGRTTTLAREFVFTAQCLVPNS